MRTVINGFHAAVSSCRGSTGGPHKTGLDAVPELRIQRFLFYKPCNEFLIMPLEPDPVFEMPYFMFGAFHIKNRERLQNNPIDSTSIIKSLHSVEYPADKF